MRSDRKKDESNLKNYYKIFWEIGMITTLVVFLVAMNVSFRAKKNKTNLTNEQEVTKMKDVIRTKQKKTPPPPPRPQVPVAVPNDQVIKDQNISLNADIHMDKPLDMPPPPKKKKKDNQENFFVAVEQMPQLKGGLGALQKKINYPDMARKAGIEGRVIVQFIVNKDGNVENPKVIRGIGGGCDKEALRVVKKAHFKPGRQRGKPVRVQYSLPIVFKLQN
ncbi:MAG TPA: energy transducer TonB [Balneolaceae bacterium]|nr:energy transducer TonB [Balneolaceae bacterium]